MDTELLADIKRTIQEGKFPVDYPHFAGADIVIKNEKNATYTSGHKLVVTPHASAVSWIISELNKLCRPHFQDNQEKEELNLLLANVASKGFAVNQDALLEVADDLVATAENWIEENPELEPEEDKFDGHGP